ncbi:MULTISPECIES: CRISPR-associated endonuclease Cas2 [Thioalkalivibrio]|uniref:CRISPR-associated endoribonuclease Cas2 n=1 Tax=Thioalkalivibrio halophilus TaxID=252474 RepID=A0A1V3A0J0_9GAMM|nr:MULTISPECIES: CRISPR-associated endonuclease Cas2 [Thioalkalivibrio]OOC10839.1 CRISPR-associated endonuclease Cas2 [Thioalkalivibrio halophilus]
MMHGDKWYLVAYDIRCPRRLRRVQREIVKDAQGLQQSVYLVRGSRQYLQELLGRLEGHMEPSVDDLRAYPVPHPARLWCGGAMVSASVERNESVEAIGVWWDWLSERIRRWRASA